MAINLNGIPFTNVTDNVARIDQQAEQVRYTTSEHSDILHSDKQGITALDDPMDVYASFSPFDVEKKITG